MTPMQCAKDTAKWLNDYFEHVDLALDYANTAKPDKGVKRIRCYAGFAPYVTNRADAATYFPVVAVRVFDVVDDEDESVVTLRMYVGTYDSDMLLGSEWLMNILETIRYALNTAKAINNQYFVRKDKKIETHVPDEQPYPQWWGYLDVRVNIPQPMPEYEEMIE